MKFRFKSFQILKLSCDQNLNAHRHIAQNSRNYFETALGHIQLNILKNMKNNINFNFIGHVFFPAFYSKVIIAFDAHLR